MNFKELDKKLREKKQQIIENITCRKCGKGIHYILTRHGSASGKVHYLLVEPEQLNIHSQDGKMHEGYEEHVCGRQ